MTLFRLGLVELAPDVSGGAATYGRAIRTMLSEMSAQGGFELVRFANQSASQAISGLDSDVVYYQKWKKDGLKARVQRTLGKSVFKRPATEVMALPEALEKHNIDLVWFLAPNQVISQVGSIPFVMTVWDLAHREVQGFPEFSHQGSWALRDSWYQKNLGRAFHVVTDSLHTGNSLERIYGLYPQHWSSGGLPLPQVLNLDDALAGSLPKKYFYYPASFWPHKNHRVLIDAMNLIEDDEVALVFTGTDEGMEGKLKAYASTLLGEGRVHFLGRVSDEQVHGLIAHSHAVVMPTCLGPTNYPPLEALSQGVPVIASNVHRFDHEPSSGLSLIDPYSPEEWAREMAAYLASRPQVKGFEGGIARATEAIQAVVSSFAQIKRVASLD